MLWLLASASVASAVQLCGSDRVGDGSWGERLEAVDPVVFAVGAVRPAGSSSEIMAGRFAGRFAGRSRDWVGVGGGRGGRQSEGPEAESRDSGEWHGLSHLNINLKQAHSDTGKVT